VSAILWKRFGGEHGQLTRAIPVRFSMVLLCCDFLRGLKANTAAPTKRVRVVKIGCAQSATSNSQAFSADAHDLRYTTPVCGPILPCCLALATEACIVCMDCSSSQWMYINVGNVTILTVTAQISTWGKQARVYTKDNDECGRTKM